MKSYQKLRTAHAAGCRLEEEGAAPLPSGRGRLAPCWVGSGLLVAAVLLSTITVWVLRQVSGGWLGPTAPPKCLLVPESQRFDCYPERRVVVTQELCESRGCCFIQSPLLAEGKQGVPWCFYPPDFPSYALESLNQTALGVVGMLVRREKAYYPRDIQRLRLDVEFETDTRLHIKITDAANPRYEVPLDVPRVTKRAENPIYSLNFSWDPFGVLLQRKATGAVLLNTTVAPLIFADQFIQISTSLPSKFLYGLGEHRDSFLHSLDWNTLTFWARDVSPTESFNLYGAHPFYLLMEEGGNAHGVFLLNSNAMEVALQPAPGLTWRTIGGVLDFYIFLGPDPNMVIQQYQQVIGFPAMPPIWALGFHLCRWGYGSSNETWQTVRAMRNYQIPQDAQWNDIDYMDGYRDFTLDSRKFTSLPSLVEDLHKHGQRYVMILDPGISSTSPHGSYWPFDEGLRRGLFLNTTKGQPLIGQVWPGFTAFPDFSNPDTHQWWLENLQHFYAHVPFDGVWIDMNEPSNFMDGSEDGCPPGELDSPPYTPAVLGDSLSAKTVCASAEQKASVHYNLHNLYGLMEAKATASALVRIRGKRPFVISRSTFPSQGRYSGHWLGDNRSQWKDMYYSIPGLLSFSLFGIPLVGADICGFSGSTSEELCTRWMQLGAFYPFSRNHNTQNEQAQDPTAFSPAARTAMKDVLLTRYSLLPFLYTLFHRAHLQGDTVARPLFFEFPRDVATWELDRQFLWGRSLLVTPVLEPGVDSVTGYIPQGTWYDFYTGSSLNSSGEMLKMSAPLDHLNLHVRGGSILPTQKPGTTTGVTRGSPLRLIVALSSHATAWGDLFWDDGESLDTFEKGNYSYVVFNVTQNTFTSTVLHASTEATKVTIGTLSIFGVQKPPSKVLLNGQEKPFSYLDNQVLTVSDLGVSLSRGFSLQWLNPAPLPRGCSSPPARQTALSRGPGRAGPLRSPQGLDLDAEREKIRREIEQLERSLQPGGADIPLPLSDSSLSSADDDEDGDDEDGDDEDSHAEMEVELEEDGSGDHGDDDEEEEDDDDEDDDDDDIESLPQDPETCLQMNHVYQEVIKEKIEEVELLIAQNKKQQKEIVSELNGPKPAKAGDGRNVLPNVFLGHFMKPYFKDKITGIGPPSNEDAKEKAAQGIKSFEQLHSTKWKTAEKTLLQKSVASDRLQRLLQPKLLKLSYWNQKLEKVKTDTEKQILEKQIKDLEQEIEEINQLPEGDLIGNRFDEHDWDKISNIHFDGQRSSEELRKFWQNWEHPSINKKEWTEEEIENLKQIAAKHNYLDWQTIAQELRTNRTAFQCLQKYQIYNKDLKRKEWTKDEDQMLLELVQEMRVGSHIPYKKIAYYMEGRDSAQLIYRWTKSVDPSLKKGAWTPEEDAMLMAAVEKFGEKDWYKIRREVPGRSDAQCRERYLKVLHRNVKKGKWSLEEEDQLIELVEKHGRGHWSKIASDLVHRTGSQCLSKWKQMIGSKKKRSGASKRCHAEESSSPSESSSEEDMELDLADSSEEEGRSTKSNEECAVPRIDLWIPTGADTQEATRERYQIQSLLSAARAGAGSSCSDIPRAGCDRDRAADKSSELNTLLRGIGQSCSTDVLVKNPAEVMAKASQCGKQVLQVSLEEVRTILRRNTRFQRKLMLKPPGSLLAKPPGEGAAAGQDAQGLQELPERAGRQPRECWRRLNLNRRLLMAVTPWVGNVLLPCTVQAGSMAFYQTKAAAVHEQMKSVSLSSTPLFALLVRLFQIDTKGCMKIIKERKLRQLELLKANARNPQQASQNTDTSSGNSSQACSQRNSQGGIPRKSVRRSALRAQSSATGALESCARAVQGAPPGQGQRQKPKTVSELLREKRLRQSQAKKALQRPVLVASPVLVSGPLVIQHPPQQIIPSAQAGSQPAAAAGTERQAQGSPVPTRTSAAGSASALVPENHSSAVPEAGDSPACSNGTDLQSSKKLKEEALESSPEGGLCPGVNPAAGEKAPDLGGCNGQVPASSSASAVLQNQALVPHQMAVVPLGLVSGTNTLSLSTPVTCELKSNGPQQTPVSLLPALVPPQAASPVIPNGILPFQWVVIPRTLLPSTVQTVVGVSQGMPAAAGKRQCQTNVTSNGNVSALGGTLVPAGAKPPHPSSAETKGPSSQLAGAPLGKAADQSTIPLPLTSVCPGSTTSSVSAVTPLCSDGSSMAPDSSAAPAASPAPCAIVLPQTQPPASTQGSDSQPVPSLTSLGRSSDFITTNGSSFSPDSSRTEIVLWPAPAAPHSNVSGNSGCSGAQELRNRPIASKPPSADVPPQPSTSSAEKNLLDFSLISLEDEGLVKEWLTGKQGVQVPSLQTRLPYLPPFLCSIKTLSKLLVQKAALEEQAASLLPSEASGDGGTGDVFHAVGELVQQKLGDNPAYLLLKARFLAAFTLPAVLATLPPPKVTTTLSASRKQHEDSDDEDWQSKKTVSESCENELTGAQDHWRNEDEPGDNDADLLNQGMRGEESPAQSALGSCTDVADARAPQIRRSARFKKRRRI